MRVMVAFLFYLFAHAAEPVPFRVMVFPHLGDYPVPQGRETVISKVEVTSESDCQQYLTSLNDQNQWVIQGSPIKTANRFLLSNTRLSRMARYFFHQSNAFYFKCEKPFKVNRLKPLESYAYEGDFVAVFDASAKGKPVRIINVIHPEQYLQGVVPSEVSSSWPAETLKAQAVAARTYAWWQVLRSRQNSASIYDLDDTIGYQAYLGITKQTPETDTAVKDTDGLVMKYDGKPIKAYFSADSGGVTESSQNGFGEDLPYLVSVAETYDLSKTNTQWTKTFTLKEISTLFGVELLNLEIRPEDRNESGRVNWVTLTALNGSVEKVPGTKWRRLLKLRSTLFEVSQDSTAGFQFNGRGYGHGVGMAQIGAREYAKQFEWNFEQILKFYYHGITLESIHEPNRE
jgi:SpoIID/LytB domain protein